MKWILGLFETILIIKGKILDRIKGFFNNGETESKIDRFRNGNLYILYGIQSTDKKGL